MKIASFFSRFAVICNGSFVVYLILKEIESRRHLSGKSDLTIPVPFLKDIIITLAVASIFVNIAMLTWYIILFSIGKRKLIPVWLAAVNVAFLIFQSWYFFVRNATV
ncbi:MAG TPA: hypothetical protein VG847_05530 [Chitinophagaceae bacterium]|nr:hypothetical protein [Chitinophagaceae bacterium]